MYIVKTLVLLSLVFLNGCATTSNNTDTNAPPTVALVFAGPVSENLSVKFKFTVVTTDPTASIIAVADATTGNTILFEENAEFIPVQLKSKDGNIVNVFQWTGYTEPVLISETSPAWLYTKQSTNSQLVVALASKNGEAIGRDIQKASYSYAGKQQILLVYNYNKKLNAAKD